MSTFWVCGKLIEDQTIENTDVSLVRREYASITPIKYDLTHQECLNKINCKIENLKLHF